MSLTPPSNPPAANPPGINLVLVERSIRELLSVSGYGAVTLTYKDGQLDLIEVCYTRRPKAEQRDVIDRSRQQGGD